MRRFLRWLLKPFIRFAYSDVLIGSDMSIGHMANDPGEIVVILDSGIIRVQCTMDSDEAMYVGKSLKKVAFYAGEGLEPPDDDDE